MEPVPLLAHTDHAGLVLKLVDRHPHVGGPVVSLVQRHDPGEREEGRGEDGDGPQPGGVLEVVPGLALHEEEVGQLLAGVYHSGPGETYEGVDGEEEALLLVRLHPEDQQPEVKRSLTEPVW